MTACSLIGHSPLKADVYTRSDVVQDDNLLLALWIVLCLIVVNILMR